MFLGRDVGAGFEMAVIASTAFAVADTRVNFSIMFGNTLLEFRSDPDRFVSKFIGGIMGEGTNNNF